MFPLTVCVPARQFAILNTPLPVLLMASWLLV
jgi:hypothetical protein